MTAHDLEPYSGEIELTRPGRTLFQTDDPVEVLDHARQVADALKTALDESGMTMRIGRSEHVLIDGWQTLGSMLGVSPHIVWSRPLPDGDGWEARAEARTVDGRIVGSGEAMVTRAERNWRGAEDYALRSMAQTRAQSKALRGPLGFVITLAGRNATPAEEVAPEPDLPAWAADIPDDAIDRVGDYLATILRAVGHPEPEREALAIGSAIHEHCGRFPDACARLTRLLEQAVPRPASDDDDLPWAEAAQPEADADADSTIPGASDDVATSEEEGTNR